MFADASYSYAKQHERKCGCNEIGIKPGSPAFHSEDSDDIENDLTKVNNNSICLEPNNLVIHMMIFLIESFRSISDILTKLKE
jgi:hypothetical protein